MKILAEKGHIHVAGMSLEYRLIGAPPSRSPTIVMLHEGLGSASAWGKFPRRVFEHTRANVFIYSRAGYGASPPVRDSLPIDYVKRHALDVLPELLEAIGFRQGLLLGHSDGASMAAAYAGNIEDPRVLGLVLIAPHFCVEPETLAEIRNARKAFETGDLRQRLARYHKDVDAAFFGWNDVWLRPEFAKFNLRKELTRISIPMLIIRGDGDRYGTHRQVQIAQEICKGPIETLLMPNCGHVPHRKKPAETVEAIARFYQRVMPEQIS
ncbi:MAG: alpha/beta hydrolase [Xanthobacteraceae bacterium]|jgi:pimeloyl-ACP methyl ester carboxylesterase